MRRTARLPAVKIDKAAMETDAHNSTFAVPHAFFDLFARRYSAAESLYYILLRKLIAQSAAPNGWALLHDAAGPTALQGNPTFAFYGVSARTCKSARKKLLADGLIATRYARNRKGHRIGTEYRLLDEGFSRAPKAVHQAILGNLGQGGATGGFADKERPLGAFSRVVEGPRGGDSPALDKEGITRLG